MRHVESLGPTSGPIFAQTIYTDTDGYVEVVTYLAKPLTEWQLKLQELRSKHDSEFKKAVEIKPVDFFKKYVKKAGDELERHPVREDLDVWHLAYALFLKDIYLGFPKDLVDALKQINFSVESEVIENDALTLFQMLKNGAAWDSWQFTSIDFGKTGYPSRQVRLFRVEAQPEKLRQRVKIRPVEYDEISINLPKNP